MVLTSKYSFCITREKSFWLAFQGTITKAYSLAFKLFNVEESSTEIALYPKTNLWDHIWLCWQWNRGRLKFFSEEQKSFFQRKFCFRRFLKPTEIEDFHAKLISHPYIPLKQEHETEKQRRLSIFQNRKLLLKPSPTHHILHVTFIILGFDSVTIGTISSLIISLRWKWPNINRLFAVFWQNL